MKNLRQITLKWLIGWRKRWNGHRMLSIRTAKPLGHTNMCLIFKNWVLRLVETGIVENEWMNDDFRSWQRWVCLLFIDERLYTGWQWITRNNSVLNPWYFNKINFSWCWSWIQLLCKLYLSIVNYITNPSKEWKRMLKIISMRSQIRRRERWAFGQVK